MTQGQWGVTTEQEAEEKRRMQEFQESIPKMRSQLRILTHFYQVPPPANNHLCAFNVFRIAFNFDLIFNLVSLIWSQSIVQQFLVLLMTSLDESLRFLSFRLDFNEHYRFVFYNSSDK